MKKMFLVLMLSQVVAPMFAQPFRYTTKVFTEVDTLKNIEYAVAPWLDKPIDFLSDYNVHEGETTTRERPLLLDIYQPRGDTLKNRPAIIFVHGGAFLLGSKENEDMVALCDSFARRGYVTASIDYRLGIGAAVTRIFGVIIQVSVPEKNVRRAVYRGVQDGRAAVRYLKQNADFYGIDTTKIYMAGSSAGAFVALYNIFYNVSGEIPPEVFAAPSLGGLDAVGVNNFGGFSNAVVSYWGAIEKTTVIDGESPPVFLVHGVADKIVPFKIGIPLESSLPANPLITVSMPQTFGSYCIDSVLSTRNLYHETYFAEGKGHEFYGCNTGDFPEEGPNQYWDTILGKTSEFLFDRFKPSADFEVSVDGLTVFFTNYSSELSQYDWDFGDGSGSNETNPVHLYANPGIYSVRLKVKNANLACDTLTKVVVAGGTGITGEPRRGALQIYPNPTSGEIRLNGFDTIDKVMVYSLGGTKLLLFDEITDHKIDVGTLQPGIYFLEVHNSKGKHIFKFVLDHTFH